MSIPEHYSNDLSRAKVILHKLGETFKDFESHSLSILTLNDEWGNLQNSLAEVHNSLENRVKEVESKEREKEREIEATKRRLQNMELRYKEVEAKERSMEEKLKEVNMKEKQVKEWYEGLELEIEERGKAVEMRENRLAETEVEKLRAVKVREEKVSNREERCCLREKQVEENANGVELRVKLKEKELSEFSEELKLKEKKLSEFSEELKLKEKELSDFSEELKSKEENLVLKYEEMDEQYNGIRLKEKELRSDMENVNELLKGIELKEREIYERCKELEVKEKKYQDSVKNMGLKEREIVERCEELEAKEKEYDEDVKIMGWKQQVLSARLRTVETKEKYVAEKCPALAAEEKQINDKTKALDLREKELNAKYQMVELKEKRVGDQQHGLELKEKEINKLHEKVVLEEEEVNERHKALELKEKQIGERCKDAILKEKDIDKRYQAMEAKEKEYQDSVKNMGLKEREIVERCEVLEAKEKEFQEGLKTMGLKEREIVERCEELEAKKKEYQEDVKKMGLKEREIVERCEVLEAKKKKFEEELSVRLGRVETREKDVEEKFQALGVEVKKIDERHKALELNEKHIDERCKDAILKQKDIEKRYQAMETKEKAINNRCRMLKLNEKQIEEHSLGIEMREMEVRELLETVELKEKQVEKGRKALELKEKEVMELCKAVESKKKEVMELKETQIDERCKHLELKEKELNEQSQALDTKEKHISNDLKALDFTEEQMNEKQICDPCTVEEVTKKQIDGCSILAHCESSKLRDSQVVDSNLTQLSQDVEIQLLCTNMDSNGVRSFLVEHLKDLKLKNEGLLDALRSAPNPAELVLDVSKKFHQKFPCSNQTNATKNSCIFLLEQLVKLSPPIPSYVKEEAKVFATLWKARLKGADVIIDTYGFLQFLAAFKLASSYDANELLSLFDVFYCVNEVYRPDDNICLCHALGLFEKIPGRIKFLIERQNWLLALKYVLVFKLESDFPPVPLLEAHLALLMRQVNDVQKDGTPISKIQASQLELERLKKVVECVASLKFEHKFPVDSLVSRIQELKNFERNRENFKEMKKRDASSCTSIGHLDQQDKRPRMGPDHLIPQVASRDGTSFPQPLQHPVILMTPNLLPNLQQRNISASNGPSYNAVKPQLFPGQFVLPGNHIFGGPMPVYYGVKKMGLKERENVERCEVLEVKKNEYEECVKKMGLKEREIVEHFGVSEAKEKKMGLKEKEINELHKDLELKEKQIDELCKDAILKEKDIDKRFQAMEMKEKHVNIEKGREALELKETQIVECSKVIEMKEKEVTELCEAVELNIKEVDKGNEALKLKETQIDECCKRLEPKEKELNEQSQALETKEKHIANDMKELDLTKKRMNEKQIGDPSQVEQFNEKQKEGSSILVPCESNKLREAQVVDSSQDIPQSDIPQSHCIDHFSSNLRGEIHLLCRNMYPDGLRSYLIEHVKDLKLIKEELLDALNSAPNPAKLVLDVSQKFHQNFPCSNQTNDIKNSCIFLLEQLVKLSPPIALDVKEEAKVFATFWKDRLKGAHVLMNTYGFLQFLAAFKLASLYDADELLSLFDYLYRQNEVYRPDDNPYLCHALGLSKKIPGMIEFHIGRQNWILALRYVCVFKLESNFPPVPLLEALMACLMRKVNDRLKDGTLTSKIQASYLESQSLEVVVKCVSSLKLEEKFPVNSLVSRIQQLKEFREKNKTFAPTQMKKRNTSSCTSVGSLVQQEKRTRVGPDQNTPQINSQDYTAFPQSLPHHAVHLTPNLQPNFQQGNSSASNGPIYNTLNPHLFSGQFVLPGNHPYGAPKPVYYGVKAEVKPINTWTIIHSEIKPSIGLSMDKQHPPLSTHQTTKT